EQYIMITSKIMKQRHAMVALIAFVTALKLCASAAPETSSSQAQNSKEFNFHKVQNAVVKYLLFLPKGYDANSSKRWPLMLFLHGAGERGKDIWKLTTHGPPKIVAQDPDFPFILVSPQCPDGEFWSNDQLLGLLDDVSANL